MRTCEPRQGRKAATVACSASAVVSLALSLAAGGRRVGRVRSLRVEVHPYFGYDTQRCIEQLEGLGFRAVAAQHPPDTWVFGYARD